MGIHPKKAKKTIETMELSLNHGISIKQAKPRWGSIIKKREKKKRERKAWNHRLFTGVCRHWSPISGAMLLDIGDQDDVLFWGPRTLLDTNFITARRPSHGLFSSQTLSLSLCLSVCLSLYLSISSCLSNSIISPCEGVYILRVTHKTSLFFTHFHWSTLPFSQLYYKYSLVDIHGENQSQKYGVEFLLWLSFLLYTHMPQHFTNKANRKLHSHRIYFTSSKPLILSNGFRWVDTMHLSHAIHHFMDTTFYILFIYIYI